MKILKLLFLNILLFSIFSLAAYSQTASVISENANLRGTPTSKGKVIYTLQKGSKLEVIKQKGAWFLVQHSDYIGWLHGNTIRLDESPSESIYTPGDYVIQVPKEKGNTSSQQKENSPQKEKVKRPPAIGMTTWEARESTWGEPYDVNRTTYSSGVQEQWIYKGYGRYGKTKYLFFSNGRLTSIRE